MDFSTRLRGVNPTNTVFYSPQPRAEVYCLLMNFKISKLAYSQLLRYKTYKNKLTLLLRTAKKQYYDMQLDKSKDNIKQTWRILNNVINRNKRKGSILKLHDNGQDISNPEIIANKFCQYFTKIDANLASKISPPSKSIRK